MENLAQLSWCRYKGDEGQYVRRLCEPKLPERLEHGGRAQKADHCGRQWLCGRLDSAVHLWVSFEHRD